MNDWNEEKRIVAIYRKLQQLPDEAVMLADVAWWEAQIDEYPDDEDRYDRVIDIARKFGLTLGGNDD